MRSDDTKEPRVLAKKKVARARRVVEQREGVAFDFGKKALRERLPAVGLVSDRYGAIRIWIFRKNKIFIFHLEKFLYLFKWNFFFSKKIIF